jgi:hypothetical protein
VSYRRKTYSIEALRESLCKSENTQMICSIASHARALGAFELERLALQKLSKLSPGAVIMEITDWIPGPDGVLSREIRGT